MKKSILLGIVGLSAAAVSSYGQGQILLDNYTTSGPLITYGNGAGGTLGAGITGGQWTVGLYFALGTVSSDGSAGNGTPLNLGLGSGTGATIGLLNGYAGEFLSTPAFTASASTANATITLEIVAYDGSTYALSDIRGHSAAFTMAANVPPVTSVNSVGSFMPSFAVSSVAPVPEPSSLALAGLGGFGMLMAFRRKKA